MPPLGRHFAVWACIRLETVFDSGRNAASSQHGVQWEVAEVAFEPLHLDNRGPTAASPEASLQAKARVPIAQHNLD
ncbi:hypothetical protein GCM10007160_20860 [Litchfieldella qijiaojingensis]|uniref:Uncharacterized protein n=1 Tax=Litchfieldella qijiaojingensis TaxID=980347 RepID=A0ABQ2YRR0_9GAMM|nr:hypothetical protein GCM10007160_20860 [Halomonas qijiaojingensis]